MGCRHRRRGRPRCGSHPVAVYRRHGVAERLFLYTNRSRTNFEPPPDCRPLYIYAVGSPLFLYVLRDASFRRTFFFCRARTVASDEEKKRRTEQPDGTISDRFQLNGRFVSVFPRLLLTE